MKPEFGKPEQKREYADKVKAERARELEEAQAIRRCAGYIVYGTKTEKLLRIYGEAVFRKAIALVNDTNPKSTLKH